MSNNANIFAVAAAMAALPSADQHGRELIDTLKSMKGERSRDGTGYFDLEISDKMYQQRKTGLLIKAGLRDEKSGRWANEAQGGAPADARKVFSVDINNAGVGIMQLVDDNRLPTTVTAVHPSFLIDDLKAWHRSHVAPLVTFDPPAPAAP